MGFLSLFSVKEETRLSFEKRGVDSHGKSREALKRVWKIEEWMSEGNLEGVACGAEDSKSVMAPSHMAKAFSSRLSLSIGDQISYKEHQSAWGPKHTNNVSVSTGQPGQGLRSCPYTWTHQASTWYEHCSGPGETKLTRIGVSSELRQSRAGAQPQAFDIPFQFLFSIGSHWEQSGGA